MLLTPVAITVARQVGVPPLPFAMTTLWLANTASLLLPVSNLTNLLALHHMNLLGVGQRGYLRLAWAPALAAILATVVLLAVRHRRSLSGRYAPDAPPEPHDKVLLWVAAGCCVLLGPAFVTGVVPAIPSAVAAAVLLVAVVVRDRSLLRRISVPWLMVLGVSVLFVVVDIALTHGLREVLASLVGSGTDAGALFRLGAVGAVSANVVNNLPAYLALEAVSSDAPVRLMALLVGVNAGPLVTVWASLATLLWRQRCRTQDLEVGAAVPGPRRPALRRRQRGGRPRRPGRLRLTRGPSGFRRARPAAAVGGQDRPSPRGPSTWARCRSPLSPRRARRSCGR